METTTTMDRISKARGLPVFSSDGDKIGTIEEIFYDYETRQPEWVGIGTGFFGTKRALVPVEGADLRSDGFYVPYSKDQVKDSPDVDSDEISQDLERELYSHYGLAYSERRSESGLPEGGPGMQADEREFVTERAPTTPEGGVVAEGEPATASREYATTEREPATTGREYTAEGAPATAGREYVTEGEAPATGREYVSGERAPTEAEGTVTRHEEELRVGTQPAETGRARLRKWVETEPQEVDVELRREAARVTREPVEQPASGAEIGDQEVEVPLREEQPVVEKETVARERVGLEKDVETERQTVDEEVRKEQVDVESDRR